MKKILSILILFCLSFSFCEDILDEEITLDSVPCSLSEFCTKYIDDMDIEKFIKKELKNDYVVVSLDECIDIALKNNFDIQIKNHDFQSSRYDFQNALSKFLPIFDIESYLSDYRGSMLVGNVLQDILHETALSVSFHLRHDLTQGGKQIFEAKAKKYFAKSKRHTSNFSISTTLYLAVKYYYELLLSKIDIEIYLRNLMERNAQLLVAQALFDVGYGTSFDVVRSKNESAQAKTKLLEALNRFRAAEANLADLMGIDVECALMPFEDNIKEFNLCDEKTTIKDYFELAFKNREDLMALKDDIKYEIQVKNVYKTDFIPKPYIDFKERYQGTIEDHLGFNYILGAYIDWMPGENLSLGTITKIKSQQEKIKSIITQRENKKREIERNIVESYYNSLFNKKQVEIAKKRVEYSNESIKLAMMRFHHGDGIFLDVIEAQSEVTQARVEYADSIINYNISQTELMYSAGTLNREMIIKNYKP